MGAAGSTIAHVGDTGVVLTFSDDIFNAAEDLGQLRSRTVRGTVFTAGSQAFRIIISFASQIIVARLLLPADFGLVAMVAPLVAFLEIFRNMGLGQAIVTSPVLTHKEVNSLYWLGFALSSTCALVMMLVSPLVAAVYHQPKLVGIVVVIALQMPIGAIAGHASSIMARRMQFGTLAMIDVGVALGTFLVTAILAALGASYWSLVVGVTAGSLLRVGAEFWLVGWRPTRPEIVRSALPMLKVGGQVTGYNFLSYLNYYLDNILVGVISGPAMLGFFDRAFSLVLRPLGSVTGPVSAVATPLLSRLDDQPDVYRRSFKSMLLVMLLLGTPGLIVLSIIPHVVVGFLLGPKWLPMAAMFGSISIAAIFTTYATSAFWLFASQNRMGEQLKTATFSSCVIIISMFIGLPWGPTGIAVAYSVFAPIVHGCYCWVAGSNGPVTRGDIVRTSLPVAVAVAPGALITMFLRDHTSLSPLLLIGLSGILAYFTSFCVILTFSSGRALLAFAVRNLRALRTEGA